MNFRNSFPLWKTFRCVDEEPLGETMLKIDGGIDNRYKTVQPTFCNLPHTKLILNSWGDVSMCCHQLEQLGKLNKNTDVLDLWTSPLAKSIRRETNQGKLHSHCTSANSCPFIVGERTVYQREMYKNCAYPTYVEICLPDKHCNVGGENPTDDNPACIMCQRNFNVPKQPDLTEFLCEKTKPLMPYLNHLCVLGIAEPFWKDAVFKVYEKLEFFRYKHRITFTTNTNGICLNERISRRFFDETLFSNLSWSLDSATPETHMKIRRLDTFDLVVKNLKRWLALREEHGKENHEVSIYNNINMLNVQEMTKMVEMASELGVDRLIMLPTYDQAGTVKLGELLLCNKNVKHFRKSAESAKKRADELGLRLQYPKRFDMIPPPSDNKNLVQIVT